MSKPPQLLDVLLADDEGAALAEGFDAAFRKAGLRLSTETLADNVLARVEEDQPAAVLLDVLFPRGGRFEPVGLELIRALKKQYPALPVVLLTATMTDDRNAPDEETLGLADFSFAKDALYGSDPGTALQHLINEVRAAIDRSTEPTGLDERLGFLVGTTKRMKDLAEQTIRLACTDISVLITGDTGTGKEELALAIHRLSRRSGGPFKALNCGEFLNEDLLQAELFGYEKDIHSRAQRAKAGVIESASGGTLFLDEIQAMTSATQQVLLRTLQFKTVRPLGSNQDRAVDVRIISATNANPDEIVAAGAFRNDVFTRLAAARLHLPALRERKEDILALALRFIEQANQEIKPSVSVLTSLREDVRARLMVYDWPGNIRELRNAVFRAVTLARSNVLTPSLFNDFEQQPIHEKIQGPTSTPINTPPSEDELTWTALMEMRGGLRRKRLIVFLRQVAAEAGTKPDGRDLAKRLGTSHDNLRRVLSEARISLRKWPNIGGNDE